METCHRPSVQQRIRDAIREAALRTPHPGRRNDVPAVKNGRPPHRVNVKRIGNVADQPGGIFRLVGQVLRQRIRRRQGEATSHAAFGSQLHAVIFASEEVAQHSRRRADDPWTGRHPLLDVLQRWRLAGDGRIHIWSGVEKIVADQIFPDLADIRALDDEIRRELALQRRAHVMRVCGPQVLIGVNGPNRCRIERARQTRVRNREQPNRPGDSGGGSVCPSEPNGSSIRP